MEAKKLTNGTVLELVHGDIVDMTTDIIVNAANTSLFMGAGVAGAIKAKGGIEIETEALSKGLIDIGEAVFTESGKLDCRFIIHAAVMGEDLHTNAQYVASATINSLLLGEKMEMGSIALPALGTGIGGFSIEKCAKIMVEQVGIFDSTSPKVLKRIFLVLFSNRAFEAFEKEYRGVS